MSESQWDDFIDGNDHKWNVKEGNKQEDLKAIYKDLTRKYHDLNNLDKMRELVACAISLQDKEDLWHVLGSDEVGFSQHSSVDQTKILKAFGVNPDKYEFSKRD